MDTIRLRRTLAEVPLPRAADGRLVRAIDVTGWLRAHAHTSLQRILCHTYGRGKHEHVPVPGWPYSIVCALGPGRSSWPAPLDALRLTSGDEAATVTAQAAGPAALHLGHPGHRNRHRHTPLRHRHRPSLGPPDDGSTSRAYGAIDTDRHSVRLDVNADVRRMKRLLRLQSPGCDRCLRMEFWHICAVIAGVPSDSKRSADAPPPTGSERGIQASGLSGCRSRWSTR
ncbi:transposase [Streptomyces sp. NBC_00154]|nr:transposase [Streptomyces sp. NBC_00154]